MDDPLAVGVVGGVGQLLDQFGGLAPGQRFAGQAVGQSARPVARRRV
jgi:hypothetical protein